MRNPATGFCDVVGQLRICGNDPLVDVVTCPCTEKYSYSTSDNAVFMHYNDVPGQAGTGVDKWYYWNNNQFTFVSETSDTLSAQPVNNCWSPVRGINTRFGPGNTPSLQELSQSNGGPKGTWKTEFFLNGVKIGERTFKIS